MRGLALATLFLGMCLVDYGTGVGMALARGVLFLVALIVIWVGA
jgi:hypothetical protein